FRGPPEHLRVDGHLQGANRDGDDHGRAVPPRSPRRGSAAAADRGIDRRRSGAQPAAADRLLGAVRSGSTPGPPFRISDAKLTESVPPDARLAPKARNSRRRKVTNTSV